MNEEIIVEQPDLKSHVIKYGVIIAVINIIITLLLYIIDVSLMASWWLAIIILVLNFCLVLYAGFQWRKENGGFLSFKSAFISTFLVLAAMGFISLCFQILLYNVIDPDLRETLTDASIEQAQAMMESFGAPDEQMDEALEKARETTYEKFSVGGMFQTYLWSLIFYAIGALIIGAIVKKNKPEFE